MQRQTLKQCSIQSSGLLKASYSLTDLFNHTPSWAHWEAFSHAVFIMQGLFKHKYLQLFTRVHTAELNLEQGE